MLGFVCLNFFPQDLFLVFKRDIFIGVTFCTASCILKSFVCLCCLGISNTLCFTITRLEVALLLVYIKPVSVLCSMLNTFQG